MLLKTVKAALLLVHLFILGLGGWLYFESREAARETPRTILFDVENGRGVRAIAAALKEKGIIRKRWPLVWQYEFFFFPKSLKAGEYQFRSTQTRSEILEDLVRGKIYLHAVTIAEGLTAREMTGSFLAAGLGATEDFEKAFGETSAIEEWDGKARNLEGYLFPETYRFAKGTTASEIFEKMTAQFIAVFDESWRRRAVELRMSIRDVVTLASLIEKETSLAEEKSLVSAVFHNRLRLGMSLGCDPTIIYVLKQQGLFEGRLHARHLKLDNPYNTYLYPGLPPGPICNPGRDSLRAALYPGPEDYLYFVSRNDGSHAFSRTLREHQAAVKRFQRPL